MVTCPAVWIGPCGGGVVPVVVATVMRGRGQCPLWCSRAGISPEWGGVVWLPRHSELWKSSQLLCVHTMCTTFI